ncbi:MAG: hypothetical protein WC521_08485 [Bdellovibrionales bacterium]
MGTRNIRKRRDAVADPTASGFDATVRVPMQTRRARVKCRLDVAKKLVRITLIRPAFFG